MGVCLIFAPVFGVTYFVLPLMLLLERSFFQLRPIKKTTGTEQTNYKGSKEYISLTFAMILAVIYNSAMF